MQRFSLPGVSIQLPPIGKGTKFENFWDKNSLSQWKRKITKDMTFFRRIMMIVVKRFSWTPRQSSAILDLL